MNIYLCTLSIVHYEGTLAETGEVFDTTHEDNSIFSFEIGQGAVIKAWDIALRTMKVCKCSSFWCGLHHFCLTWFGISKN
jgi:FKBP-type peptidyl-prolyl cis-trans isomerase